MKLERKKKYFKLIEMVMAYLKKESKKFCKKNFLANWNVKIEKIVKEVMKTSILRLKIQERERQRILYKKLVDLY